MSRRTFGEFKSRLQRILGNRGFTDGDLEKWIFDGIDDMAGATDQKQLRCFVDLVLTAGVDNYEMPGDFAATLSCVIVGHHKMTRMEWKDYAHKDRSETGVPEEYMRDNEGLWIWPSPDSEETYTLRMFYTRHHPRFEDDASTTILPATWDRMILLLAAHHAFMDLGEEARADAFLGRAASYGRSRIMQQEWEKRDEPERGLNIATSEADLRTLDS